MGVGCGRAGVEGSQPPTQGGVLRGRTCARQKQLLCLEERCEVHLCPDCLCTDHLLQLGLLLQWKKKKKLDVSQYGAERRYDLLLFTDNPALCSIGFEVGTSSDDE